MATNKTKAVAAKKPAVKKVGRSGQTAGAAKPAAVKCDPVAKPATKAVKKLHQIVEPAPAKGRAAAKRKMFDAKQTEAMAKPVLDHLHAASKTPKTPNSGISGQHVPAKKVAAKKPVAAKSPKSVSPSATSALNSSTPSAASSVPTSAQSSDTAQATAPDGGKPEAIAAAITKAVTGLNGTANITRKDISRVVHREVIGKTNNVTASVRGDIYAHVLTDAFVRADETLKEFPGQHRSAMRPFVTFFERFWGVIENRTDIQRNFDETTFRNFLDENVNTLLTHGEYARFSFACGARAIVHHTFAGSAVMTIAPNEFVAQLKRMPFADKQAVEEQARRNPPVFSFYSSVAMGLSALVRCDVDQPGLSLMVLNRVFGDPIDYALHLGDTCLATSVETLLDHLVDKEAQVLRKAA